MRPHIHRIRSLRPLRPPNRFFTHFDRPRPQLPFLSQPRNPRPQVRWVTTERKRWLKEEFKFATKATIAIWAVLGLSTVMLYGFGHVILEQQFPTPDEWTFTSRENYRTAKMKLKSEDDDSYGPTNWPRIGAKFQNLIERLEDPAIDGKGLKEQDEGGILVEGVGKTGYDITGKSEPWRRGYYEALMGAAKAAEFLESFVEDKTRNMSFPATSVIGPSNPWPVPLPPGSPEPPRQENCEKAYPPPETFYMRILTTLGFTERQRIDAALGYAGYLEYKGTTDAAADMLQWAMDIATGSSGNPKKLFDAAGAIMTEAGPVSDNILTVTTAIAVHHARIGNISTALPILVSILRSRRSLPDESPTRSTLPSDNTESGAFFSNLYFIARSVFIPPPYPPSPPDGTLPPQKDANERCEEAGLMIYIGEILYSTSKSVAGKEDGLAWTREAVDISEEELRTRATFVNDKKANKTCKMCLGTGLNNWAAMVSRLALEEQEKKHETPIKVGGWLGFGGEIAQESVGRWSSEENVVRERSRRAEDVLAPLPAAKGYLWGWIKI